MGSIYDNPLEGFSSMPGNYDSYFRAAEALGSIAGFLVGFFVLIYLLAVALGILMYVLESAGLYSVAKRRGIRKPWLSWVPVGNLWILGSISDQYQYVAKGKVRNRRKVLLGLSLASILLLVPVIIAGVFTVVAGLIGQSGTDVLGISMLTIVLSLVSSVLDIVLIVFTYIALYDFYASCNPNNATVFLVLSIFFNVTEPFFVFFSRKKDLGMPPRKQEPVAEPMAVIEAASPEEELEAAPEEPQSEETNE